MAINQGPYDTESEQLNKIWGNSDDQFADAAIEDYRDQIERVKEPLYKFILYNAARAELNDPKPEGLGE